MTARATLSPARCQTPPVLQPSAFEKMLHELERISSEDNKILSPSQHAAHGKDSQTSQKNECEIPNGPGLEKEPSEAIQNSTAMEIVGAQGEISRPAVSVSTLCPGNHGGWRDFLKSAEACEQSPLKQHTDQVTPLMALSVILKLSQHTMHSCSWLKAPHNKYSMRFP